MRMKRYSWLLAMLVGTGCSDEASTPSASLPEPEAVQQRLQLQSFSNCAELEQYIEDTAVLDMKATLENGKKGYGIGYSGGDVLIPMGERSASAPAADMNAEKASGPGAYTTTNTQVAGVDEADFVKNDGTRIFVLSGDKLRISRSWPANTLALVSTVDIEGWPQEMFLDDQNRVVVFSNVYVPRPWDLVVGSTAGACGASMDCAYSGSNTVKVTVVDVADLEHPVVKAETYFPGSYTNSRRIGASVRLVLSDSFRYPPGLRWYPESNDPDLWENPTKRAAAYDALLPQNEALIRAQTLAAWLPPAWRKLEDGSLVKLDYECTDFARSNAPTKLGLVTVATLNLDNPTAKPARTSLVALASEVYASAKHLYLASQHWWWWPLPGQQDWTYLHKFDIQNPDKALYLASGGVEGHIVDQFSMDEDAAGDFRVATTLTTRKEDLQNPDNTWGVLETSNRVSVLGESAGELKVVGRTEDLAQGERIYSARFTGNKGYVVTFRQVDPLFTLDLSDRLAPKKVGELKVPGFSSYIHPLDDNHLLTIGTYVPEDPNAPWNARALKLTVFDVSDFAHPKEAFSQVVGTAYGWSEAQYEHKAFNYFPEKKLLAIPFSDWSQGWNGVGDYWSSFVSEVRVFHIDTATGITPQGAVSMKDIYQSTNSYGWTYYWSPWIRRSVMADDFVYAVSDAGIRVANLASLSTPVATVMFPPSNLSGGSTGTK